MTVPTRSKAKVRVALSALSTFSYNILPNVLAQAQEIRNLAIDWVLYIVALALSGYRGCPRATL